MSDCSDSDQADNHSNKALSAQGDEEKAVLEKKFADYTHDANFCIFFKIVHNRKEAEEDIRDGTFFPDFVHQFFVEAERIFGYKKPIIRLFYSASRLKRFVSFNYDDQLDFEKDKIKADDVMQYLSPVLEDIEYTQDLNQFISEVESKEEADFRPHGDLLYEFENPYVKPVLKSRAQLEQEEMVYASSMNGLATSNGNHSESSTCPSSNSQNGHPTRPMSARGLTHDSVQDPVRKRYCVFHADASTKGIKKFQSRMQSLIMWFIESATIVDYEDPRWDFFMLFEKYNPSTSENPEAPSVSTEDRYYFAGYATVYRYYAYPDKTRPRVSQMLLLPPYRRNGLGTILLQTIYDFYKKQQATLDITAEDPDEEFIAMRDYLDCKNCLKLPKFQPDILKAGWSEDIAKEAQKELRLCHRQSRKVYEILKLKSIDPTDEQARSSYRLEIKNRLNIPHRKFKLDCDKVEKRGYELPEEMRNQRDAIKLAGAMLDENYLELVKQYMHTIDKLEKASL